MPRFSSSSSLREFVSLAQTDVLLRPGRVGGCRSELLEMPRLDRERRREPESAGERRVSLQITCYQALSFCVSGLFFTLKLGCRPLSFTLKGFQKGVRCEKLHHQTRFRGSQTRVPTGGHGYTTSGDHRWIDGLLRQFAVTLSLYFRIKIGVPLH